MKDRIRDDVFDELLHPADAFEHPSEVVGDSDLTLYEKRAILSSWASDACALEAAPELRGLPRGKVVRFDDVMDALRSLDRDEGQSLKKYQKLVRRRDIFGRSRGNEGNGSSQGLDPVFAYSVCFQEANATCLNAATRGASSFPRMPHRISYASARGITGL